MPARLTQHAQAGGCASKLSPKLLDSALRMTPRQPNDRVLVGYDTADDAGVYDLTENGDRPHALVQTVDFFTPIVDDAYIFGRIAAANALSDIYAMGGRPITALSILAYPESGDRDDLNAILRGGADTLHDAGCAILGGHSVSDDQVKFGYAVTGLLNPACIWKNSTAQPGDVLVFTKKLGVGVISSALKKGIAAPDHVAASVAQMLTLNRAAAEAAGEFTVHACTDVTGFGLLGHAREMAIASSVTLTLEVNAIQFLAGAIEYSRAGAHSKGLRNNREFVSECVAMPQDIASEIEALLYDPQTSGGLLLSMPENDARRLMERLPEAYLIGSVAARSIKPIQARN